MHVLPVSSDDHASFKMGLLSTAISAISGHNDDTVMRANANIAQAMLRLKKPAFAVHYALAALQGDYSDGGDRESKAM